MLIREPDKNPTAVERLSCIEAFYPELKHAVEQLEKQVYPTNNDDDVVIRLGALEQREEVPAYVNSSPLPENWKDSSDVESDVGLIDSIQRNADFAQF